MSPSTTRLPKSARLRKSPPTTVKGRSSLLAMSARMAVSGLPRLRGAVSMVMVTVRVRAVWLWMVK